MIELYKTLLELQTIDHEIVQANADLKKFGPQIDAAEAPLKALEQEIESSRIRLADMRILSTKLEKGAASKRERLTTYDGRLEKIRNAREEAAVRTEMDLVKSALDADENEALDMMEQVRRLDLKLDDLDKQLIRIRGEAEPKKSELLQARQEVEQKIGALAATRAEKASGIDQNAVRLYERVRSGKGKSALVPLGNDGACGRCYNILPVQEQTEIKRGNGLHRCEACGAILYPEDSA